ncbi:hypothetical protein Naga_102214g2 [Nannochloropsis gaditana]|uniref:Uncharacterized protein n=1 Tax=Nannochloropsis gaditana TaxID=72520 RepID=W7SYV9_9STRA|nr:hypothetical protein Naga_102214g2 [Nannochloropsis gaditana]
MDPEKGTLGGSNSRHIAIPSVTRRPSCCPRTLHTASGHTQQSNHMFVTIRQYSIVPCRHYKRTRTSLDRLIRNRYVPIIPWAH